MNLLQAWGASNELIVRRISEPVGRLPLALRLTGRYLAGQPRFSYTVAVWRELRFALLTSHFFHLVGACIIPFMYSTAFSGSSTTGALIRPRLLRRLQQALEQGQARVPLGRYAEPMDIAAVALFLASDQAAYVTGAVIPMDGGVNPII